MSNYTEAPACKMLATNCVCCGKALVDAVSVEMGIGPDCRNGIFPDGIDDADRAIANEHVFNAAVAAQHGKVAKVVELAELIRELGFGDLADKVVRRFKKGVEKVKRNPDITITTEGDRLVVKTPFRRGDKDAFIAAWRAIPGRRFDRKRRLNTVPVTERAALWALLKRFFPGKWGVGAKGAFRVPTATQAKANTPEPPAQEDDDGAGVSEAMASAAQLDLFDDIELTAADRYERERYQ